jgi:hypothetical protein
MMGRGTARYVQSFLTKINLEKLVHLLVLLKRNSTQDFLTNAITQQSSLGIDKCNI